MYIYIYTYMYVCMCVYIYVMCVTVADGKEHMLYSLYSTFRHAFILYIYSSKCVTKETTNMMLSDTRTRTALLLALLLALLPAEAPHSGTCKQAKCDPFGRHWAVPVCLHRALREHSESLNRVFREP
jgi:hypothetical protein